MGCRSAVFGMMVASATSSCTRDRAPAPTSEPGRTATLADQAGEVETLVAVADQNGKWILARRRVRSRDIVGDYQDCKGIDRFSISIVLRDDMRYLRTVEDDRDMMEYITRRSGGKWEVDKDGVKVILHDVSYKKPDVIEHFIPVMTGHWDNFDDFESLVPFDSDAVIGSEVPKKEGTFGRMHPMHCVPEVR